MFLYDLAWVRELQRYLSCKRFIWFQKRFLRGVLDYQVINVITQGFLDFSILRASFSLIATTASARIIYWIRFHWRVLSYQMLFTLIEYIMIWAKERYKKLKIHFRKAYHSWPNLNCFNWSKVFIWISQMNVREQNFFLLLRSTELQIYCAHSQCPEALRQLIIVKTEIHIADIHFGHLKLGGRGRRENLNEKLSLKSGFYQLENKDIRCQSSVIIEAKCWLPLLHRCFTKMFSYAFLDPFIHFQNYCQAGTDFFLLSQTCFVD